MSVLKVTEHHLSLEGDPHRVKVIAEALSEYMVKHTLEDDTTLSDFRYNMEVAYQNYHNLPQDNWGFADESRAGIELYSGVINGYEVMLRSLDEDSWAVDARRDSDSERVNGFQFTDYKEAVDCYEKLLQVIKENPRDISYIA